MTFVILIILINLLLLATNIGFSHIVALVDKYMGHEKKWNDRQAKTVLGVKQILFISTTENKKKTVWRICILILGLKRFKKIRKTYCDACASVNSMSFFPNPCPLLAFSISTGRKNIINTDLVMECKKIRKLSGVTYANTSSSKQI